MLLQLHKQLPRFSVAKLWFTLSRGFIVAIVLGVVAADAARFVSTLPDLSVSQLSDYLQGWLDATMTFGWCGVAAWLIGKWRVSHKRFFSDVPRSFDSTSSGCSRLLGWLWYTLLVLLFFGASFALLIYGLPPDKLPF